MLQSTRGKMSATLFSLCALALGGASTGGCVQGEDSAGLTAEEIRSHHAMPVIYDNDGDFDDLASLAYLASMHKAGRIDLKLVSVTSAGAGLPGNAIRHARCLLERAG